MKKRKATTLIIVLLLVCGLAFSFYPALSSWLFTHRSVNTINSYEKEISNLPQEVRAIEWEKARAYNTLLRENAGTNYSEVLSVSGRGNMGVLEIPVIKVRLPIYHGVSEDVLKKGVGHIEGTSLPIGGKGTHSFLTAHTGLPSAKLFSDLDELIVGDRFTIRIMDKTLAYRIEKISVVSATETFVFDPDEERDLVTLITCTPYGVNSHRLLIQGTRIFLSPELPEISETEKPFPLLWKMFMWFILAMLVALLYKLLLVQRKMKR